MGRRRLYAMDSIQNSRGWAGPAAIRTAKRFPLLKGKMH